MPRPALSATRSTMVLDLLATHPESPLTLSEIARRLHINPSSAHAVLHALAEVGYVQRDDELLWSLGPTLVVVGAAAQRRHPLVAEARSALSDLARRHGVEGLLTTVIGDELMILESVNRSGPSSTVGQRLPAIPPVAAIHIRGERDRSAWLARAPAHQRAWLRTLLDEIAATGWVARQDRDPQPKLRRSLRHLQTHPMDVEARDAVADAASALGQPDAILTAFDGRRLYDLAHLAALASSASGSCGMYLVGFDSPVRGSDAQRYADELADTAATLSDDAAPSLQDVM